MCSQGWWGTTVWALGCPAKCWHSQLCLERVLQRMLVRTEFFWKLLGQGNTWGVAGLIQCCFQYAAGALPGSCWCQHVRAGTGAQLLGSSHTGGWAEQAARSTAQDCPLLLLARGGQERPGWAKVGSAGTSAWHGRGRLIPEQTLQAGQGKAVQVEEDRRCHSVSFTGPKICNFRIFVCSFTLHQRHSDEWDYIEGEKLFQRKETKRKHFGLSLVFS